MSISNHALAKIVHADPPHPARYIGWDDNLLLREIALRLNLVTKLLATLLFEQRCQNVENKNKNKESNEHRNNSTSSGAVPGAGDVSEEAGPPEETGEDS